MPQASKEVITLLVRQPLSDLRRLARQTQAAFLRPAHQTAIQQQWLPRSAGRRKFDVGGTVAQMVRDGLQSAPHPNPHKRGRAHMVANADYVLIRAGTVNLNVVPLRSLAATQMRPPNERSTTSLHR